MVDWRRLQFKTYQWGSRLISPRGRELTKAVDSYNCNIVAPKSPTHWPSDVTKKIDFFIVKNIVTSYLQATCEVDLSSDHLPVILTVTRAVGRIKVVPNLTNKTTDWDRYREIIDEKIALTKKIDS
jgi:hypothetical protein